MGIPFSCLSASQIDLDPNDWTNWDAHPAVRRYAVGKRIGRGGFSEVYMAKRKPILFDGQEVALKIIFLGNPKLSQAAKSLLMAESAILQRLHHAHVVDVRRTLMWHEKQILVIEEEMLHGEELLVAADEAIANYGFQMTESFAARATRQLLLAVAYLHSRCVLHRDVKTENLRLTRPTKEWVSDMGHFKLKLIDFGLACVMGTPADVGVLGTAGYIAPEVITGQPHSPAMDVYAVGVVLFILLTGMKPTSQEEAVALAYSGREAHEYPHMHGNPRWDAVSASGQALVLQMLEREPWKRPSARQALRHPFLRNFGRGKDVAAAIAAEESIKAVGGDCNDAVCAAAHACSVKETDNLQVDPDTLRHTIQAERWREVVNVIRKMRSAAAEGGAASEASGQLAASDMGARWQLALRRGYARARRNTFHYGCGRVTDAPPPRPMLPRSMSLSELHSAATPAAGIAAAGPCASAQTHAAASVAPMAAAGAPARSVHSSMSSSGPRHKTADAREQLEQLLVEQACDCKDYEECLQRAQSASK
eukprot:jgi/Ulvmu1/8073/UM004_0310.1